MKKRKGINLIFSILLAVACFLTGINVTNFSWLQAEAVSISTANLAVKAGDTVFFGEYPQSYIEESETEELVTWINKLKSQEGLTWFNSDGTSNITYGDTSLATDASKVLVEDFTLDKACRAKGALEVHNTGVSYDPATGYFTLLKDMGSLKTGDKVREFTTGYHCEYELAGNYYGDYISYKKSPSSGASWDTNPYITEAGKALYFKVEPLEWIVLNVNQSAKTAVLITKYVHDSANFSHRDTMGTYGMEWAYASSRYYLNGGSASLRPTTSETQKTFDYRNPC